MRQLTILGEKNEMDLWVIEEFERQIGYCLPKSYKELMSKYNNLWIKETSFDYVDKIGNKETTEIGFEKFSWDGQSCIQARQIHVSNKDYYGLPGLVSFGDTGAGDYICFDYRDDPETCNPKIILMYHDEYVEHDDGSATMVINFVANSFEEFVDMLYEEKD
jgi:SMI1/KNR4 family protein SUKH-1